MCQIPHGLLLYEFNRNHACMYKEHRQKCSFANGDATQTWAVVHVG